MISIYTCIFRQPPHLGVRLFPWPKDRNASLMRPPGGALPRVAAQMTMIRGFGICVSEYRFQCIPLVALLLMPIEGHDAIHVANYL